MTTSPDEAKKVRKMQAKNGQWIESKMWMRPDTPVGTAERQVYPFSRVAVSEIMKPRRWEVGGVIQFISRAQQ